MLECTVKNRILCLCLALLLSATLLPAALAAEAEGTPSEQVSSPEAEEDKKPDMHTDKASAYAIYNIENDTVVFSDGLDTVLPTASFTKLMTAVCAYELLSERLDEKFTVDASMERENSFRTSVGFLNGEEVTVRDLFGGMLTRGANDCASLLCYAAKGSVGDFVAYMNSRAADLGMKDTVYKNPTGLDEDGMVTTAADTLIIARKFYENSFLTELANTGTYTIPETNKFASRRIENKNALVWKSTDARYFDSRITGLNAGSTEEAGFYTASAVEGDMLSYIVLVLGGNVGEENFAYVLSRELAGHALGGYGYVEVIREREMFADLEVRLSTVSDRVTAGAEEQLTLYLPLKKDSEGEYEILSKLQIVPTLETETLDAPVTEGQVVGKVTVFHDGAEVGSVRLITRNSVDKSEFLGVLDMIREFTTNKVVIAVFIAAVVIAVGIYIMRSFSRKRRRLRKRYKG